MKKLNNINIFVLLVINLVVVGCNNVADKNEVMIETNKVPKVVLKKKLFTKKKQYFKFKIKSSKRKAYPRSGS